MTCRATSSRGHLLVASARGMPGRGPADPRGNGPPVLPQRRATACLLTHGHRVRLPSVSSDAPQRTRAVARRRCRDRKVPVKSAREGRPPRSRGESRCPGRLPEAETSFLVHVGESRLAAGSVGSPGAPSDGVPKSPWHCCFHLTSNQMAPQLSGFMSLAAGSPVRPSEPAL